MTCCGYCRIASHWKPAVPPHRLQRCGRPLRSPVSSIRVPRGSSHPRGAGSQHGLRTGAFQRREPSRTFVVQNLILYAYPGPGLRLAEPAAFHSSTGCRPGTYLFVTCCGTAYRIASHGQQVGLFRVRRVSYSRQALLLRRSWRPSRSGRPALLVARGCYHPREAPGFRLTASDPETRPCMTRRMRNDAQSRNWEST